MPTRSPISAPLPVLIALLELGSTSSAQTVRLNAPLVRGGDVHAMALAGDRLIYLADQETNDDFELFTVPADASEAPRKLNGPRPPGQRALEDYRDSFRVSPSGDWIVYRADETLLGVFELHAVHADGRSAPVRLHPPLDGARDVELGFGITPDGTRVLFLSDEEFDQRIQLYSAPIDGSAAPSVLNAPLGTTEDVFGFVVDPTGSRVALQVKRGGGLGHILFVRELFGSGEITRLTPASADLVILKRWTRFSPDGRRLVYGVDSANGIEDRQVYSVSVPGTEPPALLSGGVPHRDVSGFELVDDEELVFHRAGMREVLFRAALRGGEAPFRLEIGVLPEDLWRLSAATGRVIYFKRHDGQAFGDLFSLPVDASTGPAVLASGLDLRQLALTPDGTRLACVDRNRVLAGPVDGSAPLVQLNGTPRADERIDFLRCAEDGNSVLFLADRASPYRFDLYQAPLAGDAPARRVNDELVSGGRIERDFLVTRSGDRVIYRADQERDNDVELFVRPLPRPHRGAR